MRLPVYARTHTHTHTHTHKQGALRQLHLLLPETPPAYQARVLSLGSLILQLARVCVWSAIADVGHGDISRSSLAAFDEAYARAVSYTHLTLPTTPYV